MKIKNVVLLALLLVGGVLVAHTYQNKFLSYQRVGKIREYTLPQGHKLVHFGFDPSHASECAPDRDRVFVTRPMRAGEFPETYEGYVQDGNEAPEMTYVIREWK